MLEAAMFALLGGSVVEEVEEEVGEEVKEEVEDEVGVIEEVFEFEEEVGVAEEAFVVALVVGSSLFAVERKRRARISA